MSERSYHGATSRSTMLLYQDRSNTGSAPVDGVVRSVGCGTVRAVGGSSCPSCRLKSVAQVRQVNLLVLVAGSDTLWTTAGSITWAASLS